MQRINKVSVGLNVDASDDFRCAALPLFEAGVVDCIEYSFDTGWGPNGETPWVEELANFYSSQNALFGHGVHLSALTARPDETQDWWLERFRAECARRKYVHISEHFGFMKAGTFHDGAPLPVPLCAPALELGWMRLRQLHGIAGVPVGLENLAFAFGPEDVRVQGAFLSTLLSPLDIDGFLLLDLHNIYCQSYNFNVPMERLLDHYPLERVRELHVSGGSWAFPCGERFRRDTHDGPIPEELFAALPNILARCPNVQGVIFERLGGTLPDDADRARFREDFLRLRDTLRIAPRLSTASEAPLRQTHHQAAVTQAELYAFQSALLEILYNSPSATEALAAFQIHPAFDRFGEYLAQFDARAVETASELIRKWGRR